MSVTIRTQAPGGETRRFEQYESEETGMRQLKERLDAERAASNIVSEAGNVYTVTERGGAVVHRLVLNRL